MRAEASLPTVLRKQLPSNLEKIKNGEYSREDWDYPVHMYLKETNLQVDESGSDVIQFLKGKSILVTGATGFLGKLLVEKLLRCCQDINKIYIIVRTKKEKNIEARMKEYLDNWVFLKLSEIHPNFKHKVIGISGDFEEDELGLSEESRKVLTEKVNIIYHVAATVRFNEQLKKAVKINIRGTQEIIKLAKECVKLDVLAYISSAYSNCIYKEIKEEFYPAVIDPKVVIDITEKLSSNIVDTITPGLLGSFPNTYTFTKHLTEEIIRTEAIGVPTCIQRPAIVIGSVKEPVPSWVDNIFGPIGLSMASAVGLLHIMWGNPNGKCDLVPVDYVINNCIAASYQTAKERITNKVQIFNFTTNDTNPLYWKNICLARRQGLKVISIKMLNAHFFRFTGNWYWFAFLHFTLHIIPGRVIDLVAVMLRRKPQLQKVYEKMGKFINVLSYFTLNEWRFDNTNTYKLWNSLNENDKKIFTFDMSALVWRDYFVTYVVAIREFLMLDFLDTLEQGRNRYRRLKGLNLLFICTIVSLSTYYLIKTVFCFIPIFIIFLILFFAL